MSPTRYTAVLSNRPFRSLWVNQVCLQFSYHMVNFTLLLSVWKLTESTTATSLLVLSLTLPAILFGIVAGLVADSFDRRSVMLITDACLLATLVLFVSLPPTITILLLLAFVTSSVTQFFMPAEASAIPALVEKKGLLIAQSLFSLTLNASFLLGYALAGPIVVLLGMQAPFYGAIAAVAVGLWSVSRLPALKTAEQHRGAGSLAERVRRELSEGYRFIRAHRFVSVPIGVLTVAQALVGVIGSLMPGFMEQVVRVPSTSASFLVMLPTGLGMVGGSLLAKRLSEVWARRVIVARSIQAAGILLTLMAIAPGILTFIAGGRFVHSVAGSLNQAFTVGTGLFLLSILLGLAAVLTQIIALTVLQENTPTQIKGRVFATLNMAISGLAIVPVLFAGKLADLLGIVPVLAFVGLSVFALGVLANQYRFLRTRVLVR